MKFFMILVSIGCFIFRGFAQDGIDYADIDRRALSIPVLQTSSTADIATYINNHFDSDSKKVRAIYTWVAFNIRYNTDSLHPLIFEEDREQRISSALIRRKGVCENYAAIFNDICLKSGLNSLVVEGYTRQGGSMDKSGHAWCTAFIDKQWYLYDPTWDEEAARRLNFSGNINYDYFQVPPEVFIQSHMPFDPMLQLLNYPITYKEFNNGNTQINKSKPYFNYADSITAFQKLNSLNKDLSAVFRIEKNGTRNIMATNKLNKLKMDVEIIYQDRDTTLYNAAIADYNEALAIYNSFINYRNNKFSPAKTDNDIQAIFAMIDKQIASAHLKLNEVNRSKAVLTLNTEPLQQVLNNLSAKAKEQQLFFKNYLSSAKVK